MTEHRRPSPPPKAFDRFHIAILEALYDLEHAGRSPANEEDLEGQLGYTDGAEFRLDRPLIEAALTDLQHLEQVEIDARYVITLTPGGRHVVMITRTEELLRLRREREERDTGDGERDCQPLRPW